MKKYLLLLLLSGSAFCEAQQLSIYITDNRGSKLNQYSYFIDNDSLFVTGVSDNGKTNVDYLRRRLTKSEYKRLSIFIRGFNTDSIKEKYLGDFVNLGYISYDHYPRVIEVRISTDKKKVFTNITNAYVTMLQPFFDEINILIPEEVRIGLKPEEAGRVY